MSSYSIRPRFKYTFKGKVAQWENVFVQSLQSTEQFQFTHLPGHIYIKIPLAKRHFWSPQLHLSLDQETENQIVMKGLYGPNPTVWAIFFFGYVSLGILMLFAAMWGFTRYNLNLSADVLWAIPILAFLALVLYILAQIGKKLGTNQMIELNQFYEKIIIQNIEY